jgi:hypothetical protein
MPRPALAARLTQLDAQIAVLQAQVKAGAPGPGTRGLLRKLQRTRTWYADRLSTEPGGARVYRLPQGRPRLSSETAPDLGLDVRSLL